MDSIQAPSLRLLLTGVRPIHPEVINLQVGCRQPKQGVDCDESAWRLENAQMKRRGSSRWIDFQVHEQVGLTTDMRA